ncbi:JmjC domain-containing histone demethylation protein 1 [Phlyctochytrium planicorne]|nr:JmjC domain-containing histone demethylation protein 1 [Phlyctochytrium planicorne]
MEKVDTSAITGVRLSYVCFSKVASYFSKFKRFPNLESLEFSYNNLDSLKQLNLFATLRMTKDVSLTFENNSITKSQIFIPYLLSRLSHLQMKKINGVEVTVAERSSAERRYAILSSMISKVGSGSGQNDEVSDDVGNRVIARPVKREFNARQRAQARSWVESLCNEAVQQKQPLHKNCLSANHRDGFSDIVLLLQDGMGWRGKEVHAEVVLAGLDIYPNYPLNEDVTVVRIGFTEICIPIFGPIIVRPAPPPRPQRETRSLIDYNELNHGTAEDQKKFTKLLATKRFSPCKFPYVNGETVTLDWVRKTGMREPIIVEESSGLDMRMPSNSITVNDVADMCGRDRIVEAMDVATQSDKQMTLDEWAKYYTTPEEEKRKILNVISLEISDSSLAKEVLRPRIVRDLDWIDNVWPSQSIQPEYPKVQLYCLMSVKDCYTDGFLTLKDFGGSSVFYHILSGEKIFYFIRPTPLNLKKYEKWSSSPDQSRIFLGDEVKECIEVRLTAGNTMLIPTGWIHSVYTPANSIVIGGNFLHGLNIGTQLDIFKIENRTLVPQKFRFPYFVKMQWYAAKTYLSLLRTNPESLSKWELDGLLQLANFLQEELDTANETDMSSERRVSRANIPRSITDPAKLVKNLTQALFRAQSQDVPSGIKLQLPKTSKKRKVGVEDDNGDGDGEGAEDEDHSFDEGFEGETDFHVDKNDEDWRSDCSGQESFESGEGRRSSLSSTEDDEGDVNSRQRAIKRRKKQEPKNRYKIPDDFVDDPKDLDYQETKAVFKPKKEPPVLIAHPILSKPQPAASVVKSVYIPPAAAAKKKMDIFGRLNKAIGKLKRNK